MNQAIRPDRRPLRIQLIARDNGFGLSRDLQLLQTAIQAQGHEVSQLPLSAIDEALRWKLGRGWRCQRSHSLASIRQALGLTRVDINIMFEHLWPAQLGLARQNIALPNPEWFDTKDLRHLAKIDRVWAKTQQTQDLFRQQGKATDYIGFTSADVYLPELPRQHGFFHLAGGSPRKGTERLLALWQRHPEWPQLTVVQRQPVARPSAGNIEIHSGYLPASRLQQLQNQHAIHLCPSEAEGYGHYLVEAMAVAAVTVTTDAAPMHELIQPERGRLLPAQPGAAMGMIHLQHFDEQALEAVVEELRGLSLEQLTAIGQRGRQWFLANQQAFPQRVAQALHASQRRS